MKRMIMAIVAAALAVSMSLPVFAYQVNVVGGTDNRPVPETPVYNAEHNFTDVSKEDNDIVNIAFKDGVIVGISDNTLGAEDNMKLQDLCLILWNMAGCPDAPGKKAYSAFSADKYAVSAVKWAVARSVISGTDDPQKVLTVADVKQMLYNAGYDASSIVGTPKEVTKIRALRMIIKSTKRGSIQVIEGFNHLGLYVYDR